MLSKKIQEALAGSSAIRAMFIEGKELSAKYGAENVFDFSLGNPASPAPDSVREVIKTLADQMSPLELHGYMDNSGFLDVRETIAFDLNQRFLTSFAGSQIVMTVGAAGGLNILFKTLLDPGDEVVVFAPFFAEYRNYTNNFDAILVTVEPDRTDFQPNLAAFSDAVTAKTKIVLVNTPNNPTGVIYSDETLAGIGEILREKEKEYGTTIYLVSDEPYRELIYDGETEKFLTKFYQNTIVGYSFSKSLSLPGERIGYLAVPEECEDADEILQGLNIANRILGFVNAPSLIQKSVAMCIQEKTDLSFYDKNRITLYEGLTRLGFECIRPKGAFYLWMKSPIENEKEFIAAAKKYNIIMVSGAAFGCGGYVRLSYCIPHIQILRSLKMFEQLAKDFSTDI
ncbi:MAG: pyridoxal phosphate-dependent aminotransferase [Lachnospiraceae bacterium]